MTPETISLIVQIIGVMLVPASLIFVGMQMRQTHAIERANAQRDLLRQCQEWLNLLNEVPGMFDDVRDCLHDYRGQDAFKRHSFFAWAFDFLFVCEQAMYQRNEKLISQVPFDGMVTAMLSVIVTPGGRQWWEEAKVLVGREISELMSDRLAADEARLPPPWYELATHFRALE